MDTSNGHQHDPGRGQWFRSKTGWAWIGFIAVAAFFLLTEHRAHLLGFLPFLIVLACPLMHLFHHGGHGSHGAQGGRSGQDQDPAQGERS
jgi:cell division protein FtsW (lipid II flippase)